jgi:hypothetical protein
MNEQSKHLTAIVNNTDGYEDANQEERVNGPFLKFVDGEWSIGGIPIDDRTYRPLALAVAHTATRWRDQSVVDEIVDKPLPDLDELNAAIPKEEWELNMDGQPRAPWSDTFKIYFLDTATGERAIYATSTIGGKIAWGRLVDKTQWMRRLRGENVVARVELGTAPMKTRFGMKKRPDFKILEWVDLNSGTPLPATDAPQLQKVEEPTVAEDLNDEIPWRR